MSEEIQNAAIAEQPTEAQTMDASIDAAVCESIGKEPETVAEEPDVKAEKEQKEEPVAEDKAGKSPVAADESAAPAEPEKKDLTNEESVVGAEDPADEVGDTIKAMEDEGGYDPNLMKLLKGLAAENRKLKAAGVSAERQSFFDKQFGSLDEGVRRHVDAPHKSQLKSKFDMLMAGYKATKAKVSQESVFQEAAKLALGDLMEKAAEDRKTAALEERRKLALARPGGESGQRRNKGPVTEEDIASEIWDQINN